MGLSVRLEDENGAPVAEEVYDPRNLLHRLLPSHDDASYQCLRFVDWYGDTVFNRLQMPVFLADLSTIRRFARGIEERELLARIGDLAEQCQRGVHLYLKFYGD